MTVKYTFKGSSEYGFKYENEKPQLIAENKPRNTFELEHYNEGNIRIGILTAFTGKLYGLAGLSFEGGPAFDLSVANTMPRGVYVYDKGFSEANDEVKLAFGIDMKMEPAELKVLGKKLIPSTGTIAWESFIALETKDESPLPKFDNPDANEVATGKINVKSTIERNFLNYPVSEFGFCVEKSAGECKNGNGKRDPKSESIANGKKLSFNSTFDGLEEGTTYRIMPYFKNGVGGTYYDKATFYPQSSSSSSNPSSSSSESPSSSSVPPPPPPVNGAVTIGSQVWMSRNLDVNVPGSKCYDNDPTNCAKYGRLYTWDAAMSACPSGWRLPNNDDWNVLIKTVQGDAGTKLKARKDWNENGNGTDEFGFSALPGGWGSGDHFEFVGSRGYWWSALELDSSAAINRNMRDYYYGVHISYDFKSNLQSVRCIKN